MITCPKCQSAVDFDEEELDIGDEFTCEECGANLRVADKDPLELEPSDDDEDEDDDDDDFEEDDEDEDEEEDEDDEEEEW